MSPSTKDIATIAILDTKLSEAISQIAELKSRFDVFQTGFLQKDLYNVRHEELVQKVAENTAEIHYLQKSRWVAPTLSLFLGGLLTFLVTYALTHH